MAVGAAGGLGASASRSGCACSIDGTQVSWYDFGIGFAVEALRAPYVP